MTEAYDLIDGVNEIGVASIRAQTGFESFGGTMDILDQMKAAAPQIPNGIRTERGPLW